MSNFLNMFLKVLSSLIGQRHDDVPQPAVQRPSVLHRVEHGQEILVGVQVKVPSCHVVAYLWDKDILFWQ
jgi:hypothetical protein